jgi:hypothetical protein
MDEERTDDVLADVKPDRRTFVKGIVAATAFATPMVASYDMQSLSKSVAHAAKPISSNQS